VPAGISRNTFVSWAANGFYGGKTTLPQVHHGAVRVGGHRARMIGLVTFDGDQSDSGSRRRPVRARHWVKCRRATLKYSPTATVSRRICQHRPRPSRKKKGARPFLTGLQLFPVLKQMLNIGRGRRICSLWRSSTEAGDSAARLCSNTDACSFSTSPPKKDIRHQYRKRDRRHHPEAKSRSHHVGSHGLLLVEQNCSWARRVGSEFRILGQKRPMPSRARAHRRKLTDDVVRWRNCSCVNYAKGSRIRQRFFSLDRRTFERQQIGYRPRRVRGTGQFLLRCGVRSAERLLQLVVRRLTYDSAQRDEDLRDTLVRLAERHERSRWPDDHALERRGGW